MLFPVQQIKQIIFSFFQMRARCHQIVIPLVQVKRDGVCFLKLSDCR